MKETKSRGEGKPESPAEASLDEVLDAIETRPVRELTALLALPDSSTVDSARMD